MAEQPRFLKSADKEPKYRAPVGIFTKDEKVLSKEGFKRAGEGYYRDYEKERSETELPKTECFLPEWFS